MIQRPDFSSGPNQGVRFSEMIQPPDSGSGPNPGARFSKLIPAARLRLWHRLGSSVFRDDSGHRFRFRLRPGSQVFRSDFGRRFRHERGLIFSLQKPRQKWRKTATISVGKLARYIYIPLPICQFMDVAVFLPKTMLFRAFWPFFCYNHFDLIFSPKTAVFLPANHRFSTLKYDHFFPLIPVAHQEPIDQK